MYDSDRISNVHNIFCKYCMEDIKKHLDNHHRIPPLVVTPNMDETIGKAVKRVLES